MESNGCEVAKSGLVDTQNTLTSKLSRKKERLESELSLIKRAEELLLANPTLKELFDIVSQVRGL